MSMYPPLRIHLAGSAGTTGKASPRLIGGEAPVSLSLSDYDVANFDLVI